MTYIVGIDEAGRGPWAGPLVVAAVKGDDQRLLFCKDSKTLTPKKRLQILKEVQMYATEIGIGWADNTYIDKYGLAKALNFAARQAFSQISKPYDYIVIDGPHDFLKIDEDIRPQIKADQKVPVVSAASIVAKVYRDNWMMQIAKLQDKWGFEVHKGYGTALHKAKIYKYGLSNLHRRSFKPIIEYEETHQHTNR